MSMPMPMPRHAMPDSEHMQARVSGTSRSKLRSSCDACGASKLRCDRGQPECGRCLAHAMPCVYSVSRKMGKPPRRPHAHDGPPPSSANRAAIDAVSTNAVSTNATSNAPTACHWPALDDDTSSLMVQLDAFDALPTFSCLDYAEWPNIDQSSIDLSSATYSTNSTNSTTSITPTSNNDNDSPCRPHTALTCESGHDCSREAYNILGSLSLFNLDDASSPKGQVPLDHVLRLSREAGERLSTLTACSRPLCANSSRELLYASIISRVLNWYRQAASSASTAATSVTPASIAVGTFNVDDLRVQAALKIQLLLGEMRRAGAMIDQFASHNSGHVWHSDESSHGGVDSLHQTLEAWLRGVHIAIVTMMRSKLRELNA